MTNEWEERKGGWKINGSMTTSPRLSWGRNERRIQKWLFVRHIPSSRRPGEGCHKINDFITFLSVLPQNCLGKVCDGQKIIFLILVSFLPHDSLGKVVIKSLIFHPPFLPSHSFFIPIAFVFSLQALRYDRCIDWPVEPGLPPQDFIILLFREIWQRG